jgi:hypothetical protein
MEWFSVQQIDDFGNVFWTSTFSDTAVFTTSTTTTEGGEAQVGFTPPSGGEYRVVAAGEDPDGREVRSSAFVWVASEMSPAAGQRRSHQLVADAESRPARRRRGSPSPFQAR